jgi:hypothetical protein
MELNAVWWMMLILHELRMFVGSSTGGRIIVLVLDLRPEPMRTGLLLARREILEDKRTTVQTFL